MLRLLLSALLFLPSVLLFGRYRGGDEPLAGVTPATAPLDRLQGAIEQEEQAGDEDDGENEDHVHARQFLVVDGLAGQCFLNTGFLNTGFPNTGFPNKGSPARAPNTVSHTGHALPRAMAAMLRA